MIRRPPRSTPLPTLFPYTTLFLRLHHHSPHLTELTSIRAPVLPQVRRHQRQQCQDEDAHHRFDHFSASSFSGSPAAKIVVPQFGHSNVGANGAGGAQSGFSTTAARTSTIRRACITDGLGGDISNRPWRSTSSTNAALASPSRCGIGKFASSIGNSTIISTDLMPDAPSTRRTATTQRASSAAGSRPQPPPTRQSGTRATTPAPAGPAPRTASQHSSRSPLSSLCLTRTRARQRNPLLRGRLTLAQLHHRIEAP